MSPLGIAEARRRFREVLDRVLAGESVEITRRGRVIAVVSPPPRTDAGPFVDEVLSWRAAWQVEDWPEDDPFGDLREPSLGRSSPW